MKSFNLIMTVLLIVSLLTSSYASNFVTSKNNTPSKHTIKLEFFFDEPSIEKVLVNGIECTRITIKDCKLYGKTGEPRLPVKPLRILLPQGRTIKNVSIETSEPVIINNIRNIELGERVYPLSTPPSTPLSPCYNESERYPSSLFNNIGIQYFRGFPIFHINLHPVQYIGETNTILYYPEMKLVVETKLHSINPLYRGLEEDKKAVLKKVDVVDEEILFTYETYTTNHENFKYVIITTEAFKNYDGVYDFNDLITQRENQGLTSTIKSVEEIYSEYPGIDKQEKIRNFIIDAYKNWGTNWVLLAGDAEFIPVRLLWDIDGADMYLASDMYYQCLDGNYDYDNDSIYGERNDGVDGGIIDLYAEVYIGRACIDSYEQLENFVRKTLTYENSQWGLDDYLLVVDSVGEFVWSGAGGWGAGYLERCIDHCTDYGQDTWGIPSQLYKITRWYERDTRYDSIDLMEDLYNGVNLINHLGHSSPTFCMRFTPTKIASLRNTNYGFWYSQGCHPGQFQVVDECIAEAWTLYENGGFAAIMNTGYGYGSNTDYDGPDNRFAREFWDALNSSFEKISRLGEANQDSKEDNMWRIDDGHAMYHNCYSTTLFGDPFVEIKGMEDIRADFQWKPSYPKPGDTIQFMDLSLNAYKLHWDFGDGNYSNERNPKHIYEEEGVYKVTLTIEGEDGEKDTCIRSVEVWNNWPPIAVPKPSLVATDTPTISFHGEDSWDPDGIVVSYHWDFDDGSTSNQPSPLHTFEEDGVYHVKLTVVDDQGKNGTSSCEIRIDRYTPPETEAVIGGEQGKNGWLISPAYISLAASDWSGVKKSKIRIDNGNWETYRLPITISAEGFHTVEYYSEDIWGNVEAPKETEFKIDSTPPSLNISIKGLKKQGWFITPVNITFEAIDHQSGVDKIMYLLAPLEEEWEEYTSAINIASDGRYTLKVYAEDKAGHISNRNQTYKFGVDLNPPTTRCILSGDPSPGGWITITLSSQDEGSGVSSIRYSIDGGEEKKYITPINVTGDGVHTIVYYAVDLLGHVEEKNTKTFTIGETPTIIIVDPKPGVYVNNERIISASNIVVAIGPIDIYCEYKPSFLFPQRVTFYINDNPVQTVYYPPFIYRWSKPAFGRKIVKVEAIFDGKKIYDEIVIYKIL